VVDSHQVAVVIVWEILSEKAFDRWAPLGKDMPRLFLSREKAERVAINVAKVAHRYNVEETQAMATHEEGYNDQEIAWWNSGPMLTVHRTDDTTFYCCGNPEWDGRDRRGAAYGWIKSREVIE
jgi:hypothetical protein